MFTLYADPTRSGDATGKTPIIRMTSAQMTDNGWMDLYRGTLHPEARAFSGNYFYLLVVEWSSDAQSANEFNAFKIGSESQLTLTPGDWAFVGAPVNVGVDPAYGSAGNSYAGSWDWFVYIPPGTTQAEFTECDADSAQAVPSGSPPDDDPGDVRVRIAPNVRHSVFNPTGSLLINTLIPSGNTVCSTKTASVVSGGTFRWNWVGVDAHNLVFVRLRYETLSDSTAVLLEVGTPTVVPSATAPNTPTPTITPTGTRTPDPTFTPTTQPVVPTRQSVGGPPLPPTVLVPILTQVGLPEASPTRTPIVSTPTATATPTPTLTPTRQAISPTSTSTIVPTPQPIATAVVVRMLPRTGIEVDGLLLVIAMSGAGIAAAGLAALRRRR